MFDISGLMKDIKIHPSDFFLASNIIVITCSCASLFKFKKYTTKFFGFLSIYIFYYTF